MAVQYAVDDGVWMQLVDHVAGVADDRGDTQRVVADGERTAQTRVTLITAARRLFGAEGFAEVGAERVARGAGMTRDALYHQFADKADLFAAVFDQVEAEIAQRVAGAVAGLDPADTTGMLLAGAGAWLGASTEPDLQRIVMLDGPSVLGWDGWRAICLRHTVGPLSLRSSKTASTAAPSRPSRSRP
jgi:AcrR family transcriptional regulator